MPLHWRIFGPSGRERRMSKEKEQPRPESPWTVTEPGETTQQMGSEGVPASEMARQVISDSRNHPDGEPVIPYTDDDLATQREDQQTRFAEAATRLGEQERLYAGGLPGLHETGEIPVTGAGVGPDDDAGEHCEHCGGRIPGDHELLTELLGWLAPAGEAFVSEFYVRLFEAAPELRHLFPPDIKVQEEKLLSAIVSLLQLFKAGDDQMEQLNSALARFGRSHTRFDPAATIEEYAAVWTVLSGVAGDMLADKVTARHAAALRRAYEYAAGLMLAAQATARLKGTGRRRREA